MHLFDRTSTAKSVRLRQLCALRLPHTTAIGSNNNNNMTVNQLIFPIRCGSSSRLLFSSPSDTFNSFICVFVAHCARVCADNVRRRESNVPPPRTRTHTHTAYRQWLSMRCYARPLGRGRAHIVHSTASQCNMCFFRAANDSPVISYSK